MPFNKIRVVYIDDTGELQTEILEVFESGEPGDPVNTLVEMTAYIEYTEG